LPPFCPDFDCESELATDGNGRSGRERAKEACRIGVGRWNGLTGTGDDLARGEETLGAPRKGLKGDDPETIVAAIFPLWMRSVSMEVGKKEGLESNLVMEGVQGRGRRPD